MKQSTEAGFDILIIGAGIIGAAIARSLSRYDLKIAWLDKENDIGRGASTANSAIIHSGHDPEPGTLKARLNREGNELWETWSQELSIPFRRSGSLVVARQGDDTRLLSILQERASQNKVQGARIWGREEVLQYEPLLNPDVIAGLWTPSAAIIDPFTAVFALAENAVINGVKLFLNTRVDRLIVEGNQITGVDTDQGKFYSKHTINCAGVYSDEIMHSAGIRSDFLINPRKGEYFIFDPQILKTHSVLFPLPGKKGKGTMVTTTMHGNTIIGPNANTALDKQDTTMTGRGMTEILGNARHLIPSLNEKDIIASYAGLRATGNLAKRDFLIEHAPGHEGLINVAGIDSPGLASAPAIAGETVRLLQETGLLLQEKSQWESTRSAPPRFKELDDSQKDKLIHQDPMWGRIVCRCEMVSEAEVVAALHSTVPARDYDGIKRRCWLGTGRCQGAFDIPRVVEIIAREMQIPVEEVTKKGRGSQFVYRRTKQSEKCL